MESLLSLLQWICLIPTIGGSVYVVLCLLAIVRHRIRPNCPAQNSPSQWPPVTILKPMCGIEKNQRTNLLSTCLQDYPEFQVVFPVQSLDDPVISLLKETQQEFGPERVSVAIENRQVGPNGKINNLIGALPDLGFP